MLYLNIYVADECYEDELARDYRGYMSQTQTGKRCQNWSTQSPHEHGYIPLLYRNSGMCTCKIENNDFQQINASNNIRLANALFATTIL